MDDNAQSSHDQWKNSTNRNEWKEVSREFHELASTLKENLTHGTNAVKTVKLAELAAQDEKQEDEELRDIKKLLKQLRKDRKDEDEAKALLKEMQINSEEAQARSAATELQVFGRLDTYMGRGPWAAKLHHGQNMADVTERHRDRQFDKGLRRTFGLGTTGRVGPTKPREHWTKEKNDE